MLESIPIIIIVSAILGTLAGLGVGGGSLLVLWLTQIVGTAPEEARIINLLFFLPCAFISGLFRRKAERPPLKLRLPAMVAGCIAAALFSLWGSKLDTAILKKLFGGLLLITGVRELLYKGK